MRKKGNIFWITSTAIFIALLVVAQTATSALGNTLITGSINNMLLIISVMTLGLASGLTVAAISPVIAKLVGIGPLWSLIPFIMAGNATFILIWFLFGNRNITKRCAARIIAIICAAAAKFFVLYIGIVKIAVPVLLRLPPKQAAVISNMFSIPQLFTALAGGTLAAAILTPIQKAIEKKQG